MLEVNSVARILQTLPGYSPNVEKNRAEARKIMEKLGYGPDKRLAIKLSTRNFPAWRDPAVIMISHLKEIYIDAELDLVDIARWYGKMARKDYTVGAVPIESGVDDPDQMFLRITCAVRCGTMADTATPN
jgi:peptide/nickel transport system substrate-binding protein